jgi:hypothetical protein
MGSILSGRAESRLANDAQNYIDQSKKAQEH